MAKCPVSEYKSRQYITEYLDYVNRHIQEVKSAWKILQQVLKHENVIYDDFLFFQTDLRIEFHDSSKFSADEFIQYAEWFYGPYGIKYDIRDDGGNGEHIHKETKEAFEKAWEHHKLNNSHHWENWTKTTEAFPNEHVCHCVCMMADWIAMGSVGKSALNYYVGNRNTILIPDWAHAFVFETLSKVQESSNA